MLTVIVKRSDEPKVIQLTQEIVMRELSSLNGSEMLLEEGWEEGLVKVRTPYVCLLEADCTLSANYLASNLGIMKKDNHNDAKGTGGYLKRAMLSSCLGYKSFANRIYNYQLDRESSGISPNRTKQSTSPYQVQIGFVPGAIIRYSSIRDTLDRFDWEADLVKLSADLSLHFWNTNRMIQINPNTTYVSTDACVEDPSLSIEVPDKVANIFSRQGVGW